MQFLCESAIAHFLLITMALSASFLIRLRFQGYIPLHIEKSANLIGFKYKIFLVQSSSELVFKNLKEFELNGKNLDFKIDGI